MINWKVRFKHKPFLVALFSLTLLLMQQVGSLFGFDTTLFNSQLTDIFNTVLAILVLWGVVTDPTTNGTFDHSDVMHRTEPRK